MLGGLELFLVAIVMFYVWRLWLKLHGEKWEPQAKFEPRLAATHEYLHERGQDRFTGRGLLMFLVVLVIESSLVVFLLLRVGR